MAQMKWLCQHARPFGREVLVPHRDRGEPSDKHDADAGLAHRNAARQLDAVNSRHHDVGHQQVIIRVVRLHQRRLAISDRIDRMAGRRNPRPRKARS